MDHLTTRPSSATAFAAELEAAAVAGYGEDWESKGRAQLAGTLPATRTGTRGVAAKIAAVVIGAAVVVSATVLVVTNTGDSPAVTQGALSVSTRTERASYETNVSVTAASGHSTSPTPT